MVDHPSREPEQSGTDGACTDQPPGRAGSAEEGYLPVEVMGQGGAQQPGGVSCEDAGGEVGETLRIL